MAETPDTWSARGVVHVDMDAFFAAVEQLDHPDWRGRPVIVGGSAEGRGVVATASYEARRYGVHSAMPSAQAARRCPDAIWAPARFARYRELSDRVMDIFRSFTPRVQQVSIDEAYLDVTPVRSEDPHPPDVARAIQGHVDALGLSCSLGVATSKTVAKIASDHEKPHGITVVRPGDEASFLTPMPVTALSGIGQSTASRLRAAGIKTLGQLAALDEHTALDLLGSWGPDVVRKAAGIDDRPVGEGRSVKSVSHEHTFATDIRQWAEVEPALRDLAIKVASRLRRAELAGRTVTVKVRYGDFTTRSASETLPSPTDLEAELVPAALDLVRRVWTPGAGLRLLGFGVSGFSAPAEQLDLFAPTPAEERQRSRALAESIDRVRERFGEDAIGFGHLESESEEQE